MKTTRFLGNCQICEADQKLHGNKMVHHGYKRPGDGYIVGDCPGVHQDPYEVSCELIKVEKTLTEASLAETEAFLSKLTSGQVKHLTKMSPYDGRSMEFFVGVTDLHTWNRMVRTVTYQTESKVRMLNGLIAHYGERIANWSVKPIRTVEEEQAKKDADQAAKKAVRDAARQAKLDKAAALKAKREALKAEVEAEAIALAAVAEMPSEKVIKKLAKKVNHVLSNCWSNHLTLESQEAFVKIGMAVRLEGREDRVFFKY